MNQDLLIFYCPGSRGDFLAAVLLDQIDQCYDQYVMNNLDLFYYKMHGLDPINNPFDLPISAADILKHRDHSIKIKLAPSDYNTVSQLAQNKGLTGLDRAASVEFWEKKHRHLDIKFGHVIWFKDLFDVEFLQSFYQRFNGRPMPQEYVPMIDHNIKLQINYTPEHHKAAQIYPRRHGRLPWARRVCLD